MTEALQVGAGRALDREIERVVFGHAVTACAQVRWELLPTVFGDWENCRVPIPHFSTDIAAAMELVEAMKAKGWRVFLTNESGQWNVGFARHDGSGEPAFAHHVTAPLAVCRAALAAVGATPTPTPAPTHEQGPSL